MGLFSISDTASAVLWLWERDRDNWLVGSHSVLHGPTRIGVWIASGAFNLSLYYDVPLCEFNAKSAFLLDGKKLSLGLWDRLALNRVITKGQSRVICEDIQHAIFKFGIERKIPQ